MSTLSKKVALLHTVLILFSATHVFSQRSDSLAGAKVYTKAEELFNDNQYKKARSAYMQSMEYFKSAKAWLGYYESLYSIGFIYWQLEDFTKADSTFKVGMTESQLQVGQASIPWVKFCRGRGLVREHSQAFDSALYFYNLSLSVFEDNPEIKDVMELKIHEGLGNTYFNIGFYNKSLEQWRIVIEKAHGKFNSDPRRVAKAHEQIGFINGFLGEYTKAEAYMNQALDYRLKNIHSRRDYIFVVQNYNTMGGMYEKSGKRLEAYNAYKKAYSLAHKHLGENSIGVIYALHNIGATFQGIDQDSALFYLQQAFEKKSKYLSHRRRNFLTTVIGLGIAHYNNGDYNNATQKFEEALQIAKSLTAGVNEFFPKIYNFLARISTAKNEFDLAFEYYNLALKANIISKLEEDSTLISDNTEYLSIELFANTLYERISLKSRLTTSKNDKLNLLKEVDIGIKVLENLRNGFSFDYDKSKLSSQLHRFYEMGGLISFDLIESTSDPLFINKFFHYSELDKAFLLKSVVSKRKSLELSNIPEEVLNKSFEIDQKISTLKHQIYVGQKEGESTASQWKELIDLNKAKVSYQGSLVDKYPNYANFLSSTSQYDVADIQQALEKEDAILEYFLLGEEVFVTIIAPDDATVLNLPGDDKLPELVNQQRLGALSHDQNMFQLTNRQLYDILFRAIEDYFQSEGIGVSKLTIVPDGILGLVSFDALIPGDGVDNFLFTDYIIKYEPSIEFAFERTDPRAAGGISNILTITPDFRSNNAVLRIDDLIAMADTVRGVIGDLPGAVTEVKEISTILDGEMLLGDKATEQSFNHLAADYAVLHFATHALVDHKNPDNSRLILSNTNDSINDGSLHAYEIYNMKLNAQLVTLSACNTGFGSLQKGEGVMSLSRAFSFAGCPSSLVSLWPASDKSSPELMKFFYENLANGMEKDLALNNAKKKYLATAKGKARDPFYWAGFVLIGDSSSVQFSNQTEYHWILFSPLILIFLYVINYRRKKSIP